MRVLISILILTGIAYGAWIFVRDRQQNEATLTVAGTEVVAELARTRQEKERGLSGRESLSKNAGMLFVYDRPGFYGIWMKDMKFAIDIIFINKDWIVIDIKEKIVPETYPDIFTPPMPAMYVLEVNAGFAEKYGLKIGDKINLEERDFFW